MITQEQEDILDTLSNAAAIVFNETFVATVNEHFGTSITAVFHSENNWDGRTNLGASGYSGPDAMGLMGLKIAEQLANALGCDSSDWNQESGRTNTCEAALRSIRKKL